MTDFKHAHLTGQDMRDHWGPIIDRIADEITDPRDARIEALEVENERLREALEPFTFREDGDDEAVSIQHPSIIVRCEVTYGDIQLARAALGDTK